jgi:hypothetical protein
LRKPKAQTANCEEKIAELAGLPGIAKDLRISVRGTSGNLT